MRSHTVFLHEITHEIITRECGTDNGLENCGVFDIYRVLSGGYNIVQILTVFKLRHVAVWSTI